MAGNEYIENSIVFKALCDENRLRILEMLTTGEKCACELLDKLNISQSTLSHHMKIMCDSKIISQRREGKWTHYSICKDGRLGAIELLDRLTSVKGEIE